MKCTVAHFMIINWRFTESKYCRPEQMMKCGIHAKINYSNVEQANYQDALLDFGEWFTNLYTSSLCRRNKSRCSSNIQFVWAFFTVFWRAKRRRKQSGGIFNLAQTSSLTPKKIIYSFWFLEEAAANQHEEKKLLLFNLPYCFSHTDHIWMNREKIILLTISSKSTKNFDQH